MQKSLHYKYPEGVCSTHGEGLIESKVLYSNN